LILADTRGERMRIARSAFAVLSAAAVSFSLAAQEPPDFTINGATLDLRWAEATIQAPSIHWKWSRAEGADPAKIDAFQCVNRMDESQAFYFLVSRQAVKPLDASGMDELVNTLRSSGPGEGWVLAHPEQAPSEIPWPGSYRLQYEFTSASATAYLHVYAGRKTRAFMTLSITLSPEEPAEFTRFTRSLFVREEKKSPAKGILTGLVLLVSAIGVIQWLRSR
jgi:hypothetical protein